MPGVELCEHYRLAGDDLFYKWEAMHYSTHVVTPGIRAFTKDTVIALKERIQRDLDAQKAKKQAGTRANLSGLQGVNLMSMGRLGIKSEPLDQKTFINAIAGPSKVRFTCSDLDTTASKERKCKYQTHP